MIRDNWDLKRFAAVALIGLSLACASTGGAKKASTVGLAASHSALNLVQDVTLQTECLKPGAPPEPVCIPPAVANQIHSKLKDAYKVHASAVDAVAALPASFDGSLTPQVLEFITKIWALVDECRALIPQSQTSKELSVKIDTLRK
jgi:hypothetical protein